MRLNGIIGAEIPYYKMMNKAMPGPAKDTKRKPKNGRLTEIDPKTNKPRLKSGVPISRAVEVLYMFENTDVLPYQIEEMKVTISNLQTRVKKVGGLAGMKTAITVILIIVAVAAVLFFLPLIIMFFSYVFGIDMDEDGGLHECIGCPNESDYCTEECRIYKKYQKRLARMEEDKEQERYLQEYAKRKQEKKNRKEGKR